MTRMDSTRFLVTQLDEPHGCWVATLTDDGRDELLVALRQVDEPIPRHVIRIPRPDNAAPLVVPLPPADPAD